MSKMKKNKKIKVFVYGDFNILHPGHLRLLKFAKESGDYLTVGVNSNNRVTVSNILDEKIRLESVRATLFVDEAFILNESPSDYIKREKPDIVVKGKEHENLYNEEVEILKSYNGRLIFTSGEIGFSAFDMLNENSDINYHNIKHHYSFLERHNITKQRFLELLDNFKKLTILVIGDSIVDEYITCNPVGMSQETPTIVVTPVHSKKFIGGSSIVAAHAKKMGAKVFYISVVGDDDNHKFIKENLDKINVQSSLIIDPTRPTTLKQRFRANNQVLLRVNHVKQHKISKEIEKDIIKIINQLIDNIDLVVFSDFSYGVLTKRIIDFITEKSLEKNIAMVADSQSSSQIGDISKFKKMALVTPTEKEIRLSLNDFESGLVVLSSKLYQKSSPKFIFTTLANDGLMIYNAYDKNDILTDMIPALNSNPKDVSGAGDSLFICSSMALCAGGNVWESAYLGSMAAAIQVGRIGNIPIDIEQIKYEVDLI